MVRRISGSNCFTFSIISLAYRLILFLAKIFLKRYDFSNAILNQGEIFSFSLYPIKVTSTPKASKPFFVNRLAL